MTRYIYHAQQTELRQSSAQKISLECSHLRSFGHKVKSVTHITRRNISRKHQIRPGHMQFFSFTSSGADNTSSHQTFRHVMFHNHGTGDI